MKAEHRKELETNALADSVGKAIQGLKQGPKTQFWMILGAVVLVAVLYTVWTIARTHSATTNSDLWEKWSTISSASELETFIKDHGKTPQGRLARFRLARQELGEGISSLGSASQRADAAGRVRKAAETYEQLIAETGDQPLLQQEALLNAGKALETLGETERALMHYRRLAKDFPTTIAAQEAQASIKRIEANPQEVSFLKQFINEKPEKDKAVAPPK